MVSEEPPSSEFWFGTDSQGRDILSRIIFGARISLSVGLVSQVLNSIIGILLGLTAGFFGKWWDDLVMGFTNVMLSIPPMIFALAIMALLGPGLINVFLALGLTNWSYTCRITRSQVLFSRSLDYVKAARALGYGRIRIMLGQILPNIVGPILIIATLGVAQAILLEAALSFLGLGTQPPDPELGRNACERAGSVFHRILDFDLSGIGDFYHCLRFESLWRWLTGCPRSSHNLPGRINIMNLKILSARIYSGNPELPWAEAICCQDDRIVALGTNSPDSSH